VTVRVAGFDQLDPVTLYALLRLRVDVFIVEQHSPYPDLDGRDLEPSTRHLWIGEPPVAYLRLLAEPDGTLRIGRVAVAPAARGTGLAGRLMDAALELVGEQDCVLNAQSYLVGFYARYGFTPTGAEFLDDGVLHTPMRRSQARVDHRR
jgi:ElaA protein